MMNARPSRRALSGRGPPPAQEIVDVAHHLAKPLEIEAVEAGLGAPEELVIRAACPLERLDGDLGGEGGLQGALVFFQRERDFAPSSALSSGYLSSPSFQTVIRSSVFRRPASA